MDETKPFPWTKRNPSRGRDKTLPMDVTKKPALNHESIKPLNCEDNVDHLLLTGLVDIILKNNFLKMMIFKHWI